METVKKCASMLFLFTRLALMFRVAKRAVTRRCPVCDEQIPVRLLERHAELEAERLENIMSSIGSTEILDIAEPDDGCVQCLCD